MTKQTQRDHDKDQDIDRAGKRGGDTGPSPYLRVRGRERMRSLMPPTLPMGSCG